MWLMYSRKSKKLNKQATDEWRGKRVDVKMGSVWGRNADCTSLIFHHKDVGFNTDWDENTLVVLEHKPNMTWLRLLNRSLWLLCWFKKKRFWARETFGQGYCNNHTRDQVSLDQGGRAEWKVVRFWIYSEGSGNKISWHFQCGLWKRDINFECHDLEG